MLIARLVFKDIIGQGVKSLRGRDLLSFMGSHRSYNVREYVIAFKGLIVQEPSGNITLIKPGAIIRLSEGQEYCKWHNGPIDKKDNPLERRYCTNISRSSLGYCLKHLRSDRALYDRCVSGMGNEALDSCRIIDTRYRGLEHVVYLTVLPTGKIKVGITRGFRIYERIAEQQHLLAARLIYTRSVLEARKLELKISNMAKISDKGLRDLIRRTNITIEQAYNLLENAVKTIKKELNLNVESENPDAEFFRIVPSKYLIQAEELKIPNETKEFKLRDYWGGYIFVEGDEGKIYAVKTTRFLHKKSITLL